MNQGVKEFSKFQKGKVILVFFVCCVYFKAMLKVAHGKTLRRHHVNKQENQELLPEQISRLKLVRYAARYFENESFWKPKCYAISLSTKYLLARRKINTTLHLGFRMNQDEYLGHSWVTFKNRILCGAISTLAFYQELRPMTNNRSVSGETQSLSEN